MKIKFNKKALSIFLMFFVVACSSSTTTTKTTRRVEPEYSYSRDSEVVETTTETTESDSASCGGILGCTVEAVGTVIALPFKAVGYLIDVIF